MWFIVVQLISAVIEPQGMPEFMQKRPCLLLDTPDRGIILQGIYEVRGDTLRLCQSRDERPTEFDAKSGYGSVLTTLQRVKDPVTR